MEVKEDINKDEIITVSKNENDINNIGNYLFGKTKNIPVPLLKENFTIFFQIKISITKKVQK